MFTLNYIEKCLNLKGVIVKNVVNIAEEQHITYLCLYKNSAAPTVDI